MGLEENLKRHLVEKIAGKGDDKKFVFKYGRGNFEAEYEEKDDTIKVFLRKMLWESYVDMSNTEVYEYKKNDLEVFEVMVS